jgi:plastocyanin
MLTRAGGAAAFAARVALLSVSLLVVPDAICVAQGAVTGRVTLLEKPGQKTTDLETAVIWLEPVTRSPSRAPGTKVQVAMRGRQFSPRVRVVQVGTTVEFPNQDPFSHNIFSSAPGSSFDLGLYGRGQTKSQVFAKAGPIPIYCDIHARMSAYVVAVATAWFAQPGPDGRWTVPGVPAGTYRVNVWHERGGVQTAPLAVPAAGVEAAAVQLDARGYAEAEHKDKFGGNYTRPGQIRY